MDRIFERHLKIPALKAIRDAGGHMLTTDLIDVLRKSLPLSEGDEAPLKGRGDDKFSQHVRNIKSHKDMPGNLIYEGLLEEISDGFRITSAGLDYLVKNGT